MRRLQRFDEGVAPDLHVAASDALHQTLPPPDAFPALHGQRKLEGFAHLLAAERVDDHGVGHLPRRPGEPGEDKNPRIEWVLSRDVFFGDEIHAVPQGCDQPDLGGAIDPGEFVAAKVLMDDADRRPVHVRLGAVDPPRKGVDAGPEVLISLDLTARCRRHLEVENVAAVLGVFVPPF